MSECRAGLAGSGAARRRTLLGQNLPQRSRPLRHGGTGPEANYSSQLALRGATPTHPYPAPPGACWEW